MDKPVKIIFDCSTGIEQTIELTEEEIAELENRNNEFKSEVEAQNAAIVAAAAARESARTKLAALGLTEAEVAALVK